jgi:hypothetical protein
MSSVYCGHALGDPVSELFCQCLSNISLWSCEVFPKSFVQGVIVQVSFIMKASPLQQLAVPRFRLLVSHSCGSSRSPKRNVPEVDLSIKRCKNLITTKSYTPNRRLLASSHLEGQLGRPVLETFVHVEPLRHTVDVQEHILSYTYLELVCRLLLGDYYRDAWLACVCS